MNVITSYDTALFRAINERYTTPFFDLVMPYITNKSNFLGVVIVAAVLVLLFGGKKDRWGLVVLLAVVLTGDLVCNTIKYAIMRVRPCNELFDVRLLAGCSKSFSLPSGHATNSFAAMVFLAVRYKGLSPLFLIFAFAVAYSRVYVGVHYPLDVTAGAVIGTAVALIYTALDRKYSVVLFDYFKKDKDITAE